MLSLSWHNRAITTHLGTKKALAINAKCLICIANLVGRGNLNLLSKMLIYKANIILFFWLEYQLEYRAKWHFT